MRITRIIAVLILAASLILSACTNTTTTPPQPNAPAPTQQPAVITLEIVSVTSPVSAGSSATLVAQTVPGATCDIGVYYKSGASTAQGLYPKTADNSGRVSWTWTVGSRTTPGNW